MPVANCPLSHRLLTSLCVLLLSQATLLEAQTEDLSASGAAVAVVGEPFGVFVVDVPLPPNHNSEAVRVTVKSSDDRVFYPAVTIRTAVNSPSPAGRRRIGREGGLLDRIRKAVRENSGASSVPVAVTVAGLFQGQSPFEVALGGDIGQVITVTPAAFSEREHQQLLGQWWSYYSAEIGRALAEKDVPKLVHQFLGATLARRFGLSYPLPSNDSDAKQSSETLETLELISAIEPLRERVLEDVLTRPPAVERNRVPLPTPPAWEPMVMPPVDGQVDTEAIASRVPPECFYLRFGSFANFVWFQEMATRFGGDIGQAVLLRGVNTEAAARMERMLAAKMTQLAKMFGGQLVGDLAVVGTDLYLKEGASLGVIFHAKNPGLLASAIEADRQSAAAKNPGASVQELEIEGKRVLLLSTPDNRIRSFYVSDGPFIFVTSSKHLLRRFLMVGRGEPSLANSPHFQWARSWMPGSNDYSVFAYFSPEFFQRLLSPHYQIELRRRLEAIAHLEVAELASQMAVAEGLPADDLPALQQAGLVPPWFDKRADGSRTLRYKEQWIDSTRGARGSFLPIADAEISSVTDLEAQEYERLASFYQEEWKRMDPLVFGVRRFRVDGFEEREKVALEAYVSPVKLEKFGWLARMLGAPSPLQVRFPADDVASLQLHMRGDSGLTPSTPDYVLFAGVKDMTPPAPADTKGFFKILQALQSSPAYIGAWPKPGLIEMLPLGIGRAFANPDLNGFSRVIGGLWRWQDPSFSMLSFDRSILENSIPQLSVEQGSDLAQGRLTVRNLEGTELAQWVNTLWYRRGLRASQGNADLLNAIHQQLKVEEADCRLTAERILDARLQCPVGGNYQLESVPVGTGTWWTSSATENSAAVAEGQPIPPPEYRAPWIEWFRGGKVHVTQGNDSLSFVGEIDLEMPPLPVELVPEQPVLPSMGFDLFSLPGKIFGGGNPSTPNADGSTPRKRF